MFNYTWFKNTNVDFPRFSIVVPVKNGQCIIKDCLYSILKNTSDPFELIIIINGCQDKTKDRILDLLYNLELKYSTNKIIEETVDVKKKVHFADTSKIARGNCCCIIVMETKQYLSQKQYINVGLQLSSAPNIIEIQSDLIMEQEGYDIALEKPFLYYNDFMTISGCSAHGNNYTNLVGYDYANICFVMSTISGGPVLFDRLKLEKLYSNNNNDACDSEKENYHQELVLKSWKEYGYRSGYIYILFNFLKTQNYHQIVHKSPEFILPFYRSLLEINSDHIQLEEDLFGKVIQNVCVVQFGNINSIHYHNANLATVAHLYYDMHFAKYRLYNDKDVEPFLKTLPPDIFKSKRGFCYWAWKPWIILDAMRNSPPDTIIIYADSGLYLFNKPQILHFIQEAQEMDYVFFDLWHSNRNYCKPECFHIFNNQNDLEKTMTDASLMFIKNNKKMQIFMEEWIRLCQTPYLLSDESQPNFIPPNNFIKSQYQEHRHDQLLLSALLRNHNYSTTGIDPQHTKTFTCHHRLRNKEQFSTFWLRLGLPQSMLTALN